MSKRRISFEETVRFEKSHKKTDRVRFELVSVELRSLVARPRRHVSLSEAVHDLASIITRLTRGVPGTD